MERTNEQRRESAFRAVLAYSDDGDIEAAITDLVADIYHLAAHDYGMEPEDVDRVAKMHYIAEMYGEKRGADTLTSR